MLFWDLFTLHILRNDRMEIPPKLRCELHKENLSFSLHKQMWRINFWIEFPIDR